MSETGPNLSNNPSMEDVYPIIAMARMLFGYNYESDMAGFKRALFDLEIQHEAVSLPVDGLTITGVVAKRDELINMSEQMVALSLVEGDYGSVMSAANSLFTFGEADYQDGLGGHAFDASLKAHMEIFLDLTGKFSNIDPYLRMAGKRLQDDAQAEINNGNRHEGLKYIRGLIHTVALNGTLGPEAKAMFDPHAVYTFN